MLSQLHPRIHQLQWTDPGNGGSVSRMEQLYGTDLNFKGKKERIKSITLKAKKDSSDDETSTSGSDDEEYAMVVRNFKKFFRRNGKFVRQPREERKSFRQRDEKKGKSDRKYFRCGYPSHSLAIV
nr:alpha/beta hydrolases superfamily protein [Tanacetum cinerariifolium]